MLGGCFTIYKDLICSIYVLYICSGAVKPEHVHSASFAKIQYVETPNTDLTTQYAHVYTPKITIPKAGKYLIIASYQTQGWKNGSGCDVNLRVVKDPKDTDIDFANFKSANWHHGVIQKAVDLSANDKIRARAEAGQAVHIQISVRLSVIPVLMF